MKKIYTNLLRELYLNKKNFIITLTAIIFSFLFHDIISEKIRYDIIIVYIYYIYLCIYFKSTIDIRYRLDMKRISHLVYSNEYYRLTTYLIHFTIILSIIYFMSILTGVVFNQYGLLLIFTSLIYLFSDILKGYTIMIISLFFLVLILNFLSYFNDFTLVIIIAIYLLNYLIVYFKELLVRDYYK